MLTRRALVKSITAGAAWAATGAHAQSRALTYVGWSHDEAASKPTLTAMFDAFRKAQPDVKLDVVGFPWAQMQQNILLRLRSGQALDVVQLAERWLPQFAGTNRMVDLNEVYGKGYLGRQMNPGLLTLGDYKGKQLGLPWTAGSIAIVGNRAVMQEAGVNRVPKTIDEFVEALRTIKKAKPQSVPYAMTTKNNNSLSPDFQVWLWTFGGELLDDKGQVLVQSPAAVRALTFMADMVKEGLAAKDIDRPDARRMFAQNQTAFYHDAPLARGFARNNSGKGTEFDRFVVAVPTPVLKNGDPPRSLAWGHLLTFFGDGKSIPSQQSLQAQFAAHLAMNDASQLAYFNSQGLFPVTNSALAQLKNDAYVSEWSATARSALRDEPSFWPNSADLTTIVGEEVQSALLALKSPQAAIDAMAKRLQAKMAELPKT
jgi:multiple sugar transport system substrate-binding protein